MNTTQTIMAIAFVGAIAYVLGAGYGVPDPAGQLENATATATPTPTEIPPPTPEPASEVTARDGDVVTSDTAAGTAGPGEIYEGGDLNESVVELWVHRYINAARQDQGLDNFTRIDRLHIVAEYHSVDMARRGYFGHISPEGNDFWDRYQQFNYQCGLTSDGKTYKGAENVAKTWWKQTIAIEGGDTRYYDTNKELARGLARQWLTSEGHRENIMSAIWRGHGIGVAARQTSDGVIVYATENFC